MPPPNAIDAIDEKAEDWESKQIGSQCPKIRIHTEVTADRTQVIIRIADNGRGMPPEVQQLIFDQFFTTKPVGKGTGLGLAIAHSIVVEKHKGMLTCTSRLGEGTELAIALDR